MQMTLKVCFLSAPTLSGWRNSLPSSTVCFTALAPGTASPSIAVVRNTRLPQTIGDECERPSIGVFHLMFFVGVHSDGRFFSFEIPEPSGPRHCGQFPAAAFSEKKLRPVNAKTIPTMIVKAIRFTVVISFVLSVLIFCAADRRLTEGVKMRHRAHDQQPIRDSGRRHHDFANRVLREQFILRSSLHNEHIAILT